MSDTWDDLAAGWDNADTQLYAELAFRSWSRKVAPLISNLPQSRVLDFGCGTGLLTERLASYCGNIAAVDTSVEMIGVLQSKVVDKNIVNVTPIATAIVDQAVCNQSELSERFDLIIASSVCALLQDYDSTVRDLSSLLRPGGIFAQWDWADEMPAQRIRKAYELAELTCISVESAFDMRMNDELMPVVLGVARRS